MIIGLSFGNLLLVIVASAAFGVAGAMYTHRKLKNKYSKQA